MRNTDTGPFAWHAFRLDKLLIDQLLQERGLHPTKKDLALNALYKLLTNSTYGELTSPYFTIANPTVGNNITMRARSMAWYAEKGLNGFQTITDGGAFDLNHVVFPYNANTVAAHQYVNLHRVTASQRERRISYGTLGGVESLTLDFEEDGEKNIALLSIDQGTPLRGMDAHHWIEEKAMEHLQRLFPEKGIRVLHEPSTRLKMDNDDKPTGFEYIPRIGLYSFELKACYDEMTLHGPANYSVWQKGKMIDRAHRSYPRKKEYVTTSVVAGQLVRVHLYDATDPASILHERLRCPTAVPRQKTFVRSTILLPSEWRHGEQSTWKHSPLKPGDSWWKAGLMRELSLSQWTYETLEQCEAWEKDSNKLRNKYGQSFEVFFLNEDDTLNFQKMITSLDAMVALGVQDPVDRLYPCHNRTRDLPMRHGELDALEQTQEHLRWWQGMTEDADVIHNPSDDIAYAVLRAEMYEAAD